MLQMAGNAIHVTRYLIVVIRLNTTQGLIHMVPVLLALYAARISLDAKATLLSNMSRKDILDISMNLDVNLIVKLVQYKLNNKVN